MSLIGDDLCDCCGLDSGMKNTPRNLVELFSSVENFDFFEISEREVSRLSLINELENTIYLSGYNIEILGSKTPDNYIIYVEERGGQNA